MPLNWPLTRTTVSALCSAALLVACGGGSDGGDSGGPLAEVNRDTLAVDRSQGLATDGDTASAVGPDGNNGDSGGSTTAALAVGANPGNAGGSDASVFPQAGTSESAPGGATVITESVNSESANTGSGSPSLPSTPVETDSTTTAGPAGAAHGSYGALTFREEWNVSALDTGKWLTRMFHWTTPELDNWRIENGVLKMWTPRMANGQFLFENRAMNTDGKFTQRYGWFEMEAKLPRGRGLWPSFWLYAHNDHTRPEIDIMEAYGGGDQWWSTADGRPIDYGATIWVSPADGSSGDMISHQRPSWNQNIRMGDLTAGFHKYGALWEPDGITFFFDGQPIAPKVKTTRLNQQMYMIIGLGTGNPGTFNAPTGETPTTIANAFEINYVRAWALPQGTTTGGTHRDPTR